MLFHFPRKSSFNRSELWASWDGGAGPFHAVVKEKAAAFLQAEAGQDGVPFL